MKIAIDTSVLIDIFGPDPTYGPMSAAAVSRFGDEHALVICDVVAGEMARVFGDKGDLLKTLGVVGIAFDPILLDAAWHAGKLHIDYRRRGGSRNRILSDFLVGAHAIVQCDALLTRDRGFYRDYFDGLNIIEP